MLAGLGRTGAVVVLAGTVGFLGASALSCAIDRGCIVTRGGVTTRESGCGSGDVVVRGRLVDAETGEPVRRDRVYVHAYDDGTKVQVSLEPDKTASNFELRLPSPEIRLRVYDMEHVHALYEKRFTAPADGKLDVEVRLEPTHWIRLHGHICYRVGDKVWPVDHGDGSIGSAPLVDIGPCSWISYDDDGAYSVLVPRELLKITMLDTNCHPVPAELDLRGATGDEREFDLYLER